MYWQNGGEGPITHGVMSFRKFSVFAILENFRNRFLTEPKKARKLKVHINVDNDWMYLVYRNRGKGSMILGVISLGRFSFSAHLCLSSDGTVARL